MKLWKKAVLGLFLGGVAVVGVFVSMIAAIMVPPASASTVTTLTVTFSRSGPVLDADPEDDLYIYVEEFASPFRINRAAQVGFLAEEFVTNVQEGEQIQLLVFKRYLPRDPQNEIFLGSIPTWNVVQGGVVYIPDRQLEQVSNGDLPFRPVTKLKYPVVLRVS